MRYLLILMVLLSGCTANPEKRAERDISRYGPYCEKLGYEPNTDQWRECIVSKSNTPRGAQTTQRCVSDGYGGVRCNSY